MLAAALLLDALIGETFWRRTGIPHPIELLGTMIGWLDGAMNQGTHRRLKGMLALCLILVVATAVPMAVLFVEYGWIIETLGAAVLLAHRSLIDHVRAVADGLRLSIEEGRRAVSQIVGRDPARLDEAGVARAAIESAAENFSDGVVAPAFWFAIGGLPGILAYKAINTADSMIGHRTAHHGEFGWASARLDDLLNWAPARLTGALFCLVDKGSAAFRVMLRDAPNHRSPNAGWPEAAMAASLGLALAGPRDYGTHQVDDPFMNPEGRAEAGPEDIDRSVHLLWRGWGLLVLMSLALAFFG